MKREKTKLEDYKAERRGLRIELRYTKIMRDHDTGQNLVLKIDLTGENFSTK